MRRGEDGATSPKMRGNQGVEPRDAVAVETVQRFVEQPQWSTGRGDPCKRRALGLTGRKKSHRDLRQSRKIERIHRLVDGPSPEPESAPQRQFAVQR